MAVMHADFSFLSCLQSAFEILVYRILRQKMSDFGTFKQGFKFTLINTFFF